MDQETDPGLEMLFSFYERLHRKAPGSEKSTRRAFSMLDGLPTEARVVDLGCGSGVASLVLAEAGADVTAVDIHQPFLDELDRRAVEVGWHDRITTIAGDMAEPTFLDGPFDLVWSEGAIYLIGFEAGLKRWKQLLKPGGAIAVTEATWLSEERPQKASAFWSREYPAMTGIEGNVAMLESAGFEPLAHFILPAEDWADYFTPLEEQLAIFLTERPADDNAKAFADAMREEIDLWRECGASYGYVFYLAKSVL